MSRLDNGEFKNIHTHDNVVGLVFTFMIKFVCTLEYTSWTNIFLNTQLAEHKRSSDSTHSTLLKSDLTSNLIRVSALEMTLSRIPYPLHHSSSAPQPLGWLSAIWDSITFGTILSWHGQSWHGM